MTSEDKFGLWVMGIIMGSITLITIATIVWR